MARYPSSSYGRRRGWNLRWVYGISALLIVAGVISFIYGYPFGKNKDEPPVNLANINMENKSQPPAEVEPQPTENRIEEPKPTVKQEAAPTPTVERVVEPEPIEEHVIEPELTKVAPKPTSEANPKVTEVINAATALIEGKPAKIIEARDRLNDALAMPMNNVQRSVIKQKLSELADDWLFSRTVYPGDRLCSTHQVRAGELFQEIGNRSKVPYEILLEINKISRPEMLRAGQTIKLVHGPFHAKVYCSTFTMDIYLQNCYVYSFRVGIGQEGKETPMGLWLVKKGGKMIKPPWSDPETGRLLNYGDPGYALGSRWIALDGIKGDAKDRTGFGIHGTVEPETIGTKSSKGCIRLHNGDVIKVYSLLTEVHSLVKVVD